MNQHNAYSKGHALHLRVAGHSETGRLRDHNADAFALYDLSDSRQAEQLGRLYLLADGTGSHATGEVASRIAIETIPAVYYYQSEGDLPLVRLQLAFIASDTRIRDFASLHHEYAEIACICSDVYVGGS